MSAASRHPRPGADLVPQTGSHPVRERRRGSGKTTRWSTGCATWSSTTRLRRRPSPAVTFTEKAGAELRDRLRAEFERMVAQRRRRRVRRPARAGARRPRRRRHRHPALVRAAAALRAPDRGPAAAPVEVLDEVGSSVAFEDRWSGMQAELLDDDGIAEPLLLGMALGVTLDQLRSLALLLGNDWDLLEDRSPAPTGASPSPVARPAPISVDGPRSGSPQCRQVHEARRQAAAPSSATSPLSWPVEPPRRSRAPRWRRSAADQRAQDGQRRHEADWSVPVVRGRVPRRAQSRRRRESIALRDRSSGQPACGTWRHWAGRSCAGRGAGPPAQRPAGVPRPAGAGPRPAAPRPPTPAPRCTSATSGCCSTSSRTPTRSRSSSPSGSPAARAGRAERLARTSTSRRAAVRGRRPEAVDLPVPPGRHRDLPRRPGSDSASTVSLTTNFRTGAADPRLGQRGLRPADHQSSRAANRRTSRSIAHRDATPDSRTGRSTVLGADDAPDRPDAATLRDARGRRRRRRDPAGARRGLEVCDERDRSVARRRRPADIAILVPARTSLPFLEDALDAAGRRLPRRVQLAGLPGARGPRPAGRAPGRSPTRPTSSPWSPRCAPRCSAAATTTCGAGSTPAARSTCSRTRRTRRSPTGPVGDGAGLPARVALDGSLADPERGAGRDRRGPPDARGRPRPDPEPGTRGAGCGSSSTRPGPGPRSQHGGLRATSPGRPARRRRGSRVAEAVLPETDVDAVRIMTIHAAKGLEFPMVILSRHDRSAPAASTASSCCGRRRRLRGQPRARTCRPTTSTALRPSTSRWTNGADPAAVRRRDPGPRPPGRLAAPHPGDNPDQLTPAELIESVGGATDTRPLPVHASRTPQPGHQSQKSLLRRTMTTGSAGSGSAGEQRTQGPLTASGLEGTEPEVVHGRSRRGRRGEGAAGPRASALDQGPLRLRGRPRRARRTPGGRPRDRLPDSHDAVRAQVSPKASSARGSRDPARRSPHWPVDLVKRAAERQHWREIYVGAPRPDGTISKASST